MQRTIDDFGKLLIRRDGKEKVGRFDRDLELVEIMVLQQLDMIER